MPGNEEETTIGGRQEGQDLCIGGLAVVAWGLVRMQHRKAFTIVELLVVVSIIGLAIGILVPSLTNARGQARATVCLSNLRMLGQGINIYAHVNNDLLLPGRLPKIDDCHAFAYVNGVRKYRPTFLALMGDAVAVPAFADPKACKTETDRFGESGDRQNYAHPMYVCPSVAAWTDERNACYGYNYQFLGNSRLRDPNEPQSYKNWAVPITRILFASSTVAVADCLGTAASWPTRQRGDYENNGRDGTQRGSEGFNLDPPRVDPVHGEMADLEGSPQLRSAADPRHRARVNVLWLDTHADGHTLLQLGYQVQPDGVIGLNGDNRQWSGVGRDIAWTR
ncbi:MAG: prepilin-type N-terminal cleavage/methylation domain-containing protein [Planctomycetota bacterium]